VLKVNHINAFYGNIQVLRDISFDVKEKEIVALIGANGAGKSTILKVVSGLLRPSSGTVEFMGNRIDGMSPRKTLELGIAHIPEGRQLFSDMTVQENLELGAYLPSSWKKKKAAIQKIYQLFPRLKERSNQLARTMSGGEQQMLTIGRGLMTGPRICMFDETSYGLAPIMTLHVLDTIKKLREAGTTVLIIEQNANLALELADRAYVLENGRIIAQGKCAELKKDEHVRIAYLGL
jgi:branched-chain amino acid transport system ATP-binding protein